MTGMVEDSEDLVQDVYAAWVTHSSNVLDPKSYLAKATINKALTYLKHRQKERESYVGIWLPEPLPDNKDFNPDDSTDVQFGILLLLEKLSPVERAVFLLRESFDLSYKEIGQEFELNEDHCRQLYHRAKEKLQGRKRYNAEPEQQQQVLDLFEKASISGDLSILLNYLKNEVAVYSDGGGKVAAAINAIIGKEQVSKFLYGLYSKAGQYLEFKFSSINGSPAAVLVVNSKIDTVILLEADETGIESIYFVRNPDKLEHLKNIF